MNSLRRLRDCFHANSWHPGELETASLLYRLSCNPAARSHFHWLLEAGNAQRKKTFLAETSLSSWLIWVLSGKITLLIRLGKMGQCTFQSAFK